MDSTSSSISLDTTLETLRKILEKSNDMSMFSGLYCIENQVPPPQTVKEILEFSTIFCDPSAKRIINYFQERIRNLLSDQTLSDVSEWLIEHTIGQEDFRSSSYYPNLCTYSPTALEMQPAEMVGRRFHKVLVISGESGVGKSFASVKLFPRKVLPENVEKSIIFYCCRDKEVSDIDATTKQARDSAAKEQLEDWFRSCWRRLKEKFPAVGETEWRKLSVVMVIDELGNRPNLFRGIISVAAEFEMEHTQLHQEREGKEVDYAKDIRLICVGTGLDWRVRAFGEIASECQNYLHLQILPWSVKAFQQYALKRFNDWTGNEINVSSLLTSLFSLKLSKLGTNARCAKFLIDELSCKKILNSLSPGSVLYNFRTEIFSHVANKYRTVNGIGSLFRDQKDALQLLFEALRLVYIGSVEHVEDSEKVVKLLTYGVLSYDGSCLRMSPAILLLLLSEFGSRDLSVLDGYGFEKLVALRELCHILIEFPLAKVEIVALTNPVPNTRANMQCDQTEFTWSLPSDYFCLDRSSERHIQKVHQDAFYIIINGPCAPAPDIMVLPSKSSGAKVRFIQAKNYRESYNPSLSDVRLELGKFGLDRSTHPATYVVMDAMAGVSAQPTFSFVLSSSGHKLLQKLQSLTTDKVIEDSVYSSHVTIPLKEVHSKKVEIYVEVIHPLWSELVVDSDSSIMTIRQTSFTAKLREDNSGWMVTDVSHKKVNKEEALYSQDEVEEHSLPDLESSDIDEATVTMRLLNIDSN